MYKHRKYKFRQEYLIMFVLLCNFSAFAQMNITNHPSPAGYTTTQTRYRNCIFVEPGGISWMGYRDIGLGRYDGSAWVMFDSLNNGFPSNNILAVTKHSNGDVWAGTPLGAVRFDGTNAIVYNTGNSGLPSNNVTAISCFGSLTLIGTSSGAALFDGTNWTTFTTVNSGLLNDTITSVLIAPSGALWIGTFRGLSEFQNNTWTTFNASNSTIPSASIIDLEYDNHGNIWVSAYGIDMITPTGQVLNFINDIWQEEMPVSVYSRGAFAKDVSGRIIFRGTAGISYFFRLDNLNYEPLEAPSLNLGPGALGYDMGMDANNILWITGRRDNTTGPGIFFSVDFNSYQPIQPSGYGGNINNYKSLDISGVKTLMLNQGDMHWDLSNPKYEVPKGSGKHSVFASALWIGGLDQGGNIHLAAQTYRQTGLDYWPGPVDGISLPFDSASCHHYNEIWKVSKWQVEEFKNKFADGSVANGTYLVPKTFLSWPAKGNNYVTDDKAPFVDFNGDNVYSPFNGDYPLIKGDQMLFWIFNDSLAPHSSTNGPKIGVEIHASAYAYKCDGIADSNSVLNYTTLYNFKIKNRSQQNYNGMYMGIWCDVDLGNATDDYIGCDTTIAAGFVYNGDNDDETAQGYGLNPPMQNVVVLKGTLADTGDGIDNDLDGIIDEPGERTTMNHFHTYVGANNTTTSNPNGFADFYNYLRSIWLNGQHVVYGNFGPNPNLPETNFIWSGTPYGSGWTEASDGNPPEDRRFLLSSGPASLPAGGELTLDFAYVFTRDSLNPNGLTTSVARNIADVQRVKSWFDNDNFPSCEVYSVAINEIENGKWEIFPNPANDFINIEHTFSENNSIKYSIADLSGRILRSSILHDSAIDISELASGFYLLTISDGVNNNTKSFIKH